MNNEIYSNPLCERYSSKEMIYNFSPDKKFSTWRKLWIALAESEKELGLDISQEQIDEMKKNQLNYWNIYQVKRFRKSFHQPTMNFL